MNTQFSSSWRRRMKINTLKTNRIENSEGYKMSASAHCENQGEAAACILTSLGRKKQAVGSENERVMPGLMDIPMATT